MNNSAMSLALLRKCGIPEWVLVDEDWKEFITYFKEGVTESNILANEELIELARLKQQENGNILSLAERMDEIAKEYGDIWSITENIIFDLDKQIEMVNQEEEFLDDLIIKARLSNFEAIEGITVLKSQKDRFLSEEPIISNKCMRQIEELQEVKLSNERKINELGQLYTKPVQSPLFMHQMSLNDYFRQLEQFICGAKHFMQKNFNLKDVDGKISSHNAKQCDKAKVLGELSMVADRLLNAYYKLYLADMNYNAKTALTNQFKAQNWSPSTLMGMRREMLQMEHDNELNMGQKQQLLNKLQEQSVELAQLDVETLIYQSNQMRMSRAKQRVEHLIRFADVISESITMSEICWVLTQLDLERMKNRNNYDSKMEMYRMDLLRCNRRIETLNMIKKLSDDSMIQCYCNHFVELLQVYSRDLCNIGVDEFIKCILSMDECKSKILKCFRNATHNPSSIFNCHDFFGNAFHIEKLAYNFLYDGPIARPRQSSPWYEIKKTCLEGEIRLVGRRNELKKEECSYYIKKWSNDKYWRQKQIYWVWFITEPKKVVKSLKSISGEAQQRSKTDASASRHFVGIVRKN